MIPAYDPHGTALLDCFRGDSSATLICYQDGVRDDVQAEFWLRDSIHPFETRALELCHGHVLDAGAGAGVHTLILQRRGLNVTAIDVSSDCVTIMRERGVCNAEVGDIYILKGDRFDTIICLCNGLDKVGRLENLPFFFDRMRELLAPGGQLLTDSFDVRVGASGETRTAIAQKQAAGRYFGELDLVFEYKGVRGSPFTVLQVDFETLVHMADLSGWRCEMLDADGGHYLLRAWPA